MAGRMQSPRFLKPVIDLLRPSVSRLELSVSPSLTIQRLKRHRFTWRHDGHYLFLFLLACINFTYIPSKLLCLGITIAYTTGVLLPISSQFVFPATPIFSWLLLYFSAGKIPVSIRPHIWVTVLPTLESVLYGANISDLLTRYTHPALDVLAWLPYGVLHFVLPFLVAASLFVFGPPGAVKHFGKIFGYINIIGVLIQISFPCSPPWYELLHGLVPANYHMGGSPGGLVRIDQFFGTHGYSSSFTNAPIPFGAFPSLHAGTSTMEALFMSHFFPKGRVFYWCYALTLYWSTMYLTHHYLIDVVAGGSLAVVCFYFMMNDEMRNMAPPQTAPDSSSKYLRNDSSDSEAMRNGIALANRNRDWGSTRQASLEEQIDQGLDSSTPFLGKADRLSEERIGRPFSR